MTLSVLIVCLGNICRSPMGEAVLKHEAEKRGIAINVDSAGTGAYHVGEPPDERTVATCREHNIPVNHLARQVEQSDFKDFQYISGDLIWTTSPSLTLTTAASRGSNDASNSARSFPMHF
ncbi:phosphotyrosine protein phosphatase I superfamily [Pisolithus thermaeus]|nr:phosphotyrosine protein phosphatase I superfamily [Pisolithus thermaeus]